MQNKIFSYNKEYLEILKQTSKYIFCKVCDYPLEYPVRCEKTDKLICNRCINNDSHVCGSIYNENLYNINGDYLIEQDLSKLKVTCANNINGCEWTGTRNEYISHYKKCKQYYKNCPFCLATISKSDDTHVCSELEEWLLFGENSKIAFIIDTFQKNSKQKNILKKELCNIFAESRFLLALVIILNVLFVLTMFTFLIQNQNKSKLPDELFLILIIRFMYIFILTGLVMEYASFAFHIPYSPYYRIKHYVRGNNFFANTFLGFDIICFFLVLRSFETSLQSSYIVCCVYFVTVIINFILDIEYLCTAVRMRSFADRIIY